MPLPAGSAYYGEFTTANPTSGAAQNADSLPAATATHNGADDASFALAVANLATGRYKVTGTIPAGYAAGDFVQVSVAATVATVAGVAVVDGFTIGPAAPTAAQMATAVWTDINATDFTAAGSPGKVLMGQLGGAFGAGTSVYTAAALANAPTGSGGGGADPWATALPGSYASGTAGYILGHPVTLSIAQALGAPRALDAVADGSVTLNDALWAAVCAAAGKESVVGTAYTIKTPSTGTVVRTFTLDSGTAPTSRS